jgi:predicted lipid-binding transport protein (Tim44 family)
MFGSRFRLSLVLGACAVVLTMIAADIADARVRISIGSRGSRTHSAPPATTTAPTARPVERSATQPTNPTVNAAPRPAPRVGVVPVVSVPLTPGATNNSPGFMGGLVGAGLFGLVLGAGLTGGLGSPASFVGLAVQMAIVAAIGWALFGLMPDRNPSPANVPIPNQRPPRNRSEFGLRNATPR